MDYIEALRKEHSRSNTDAIANFIGKDPVRFKKIIDIIYSAEAPLPQRASWLLAIISRKHPEVITPYIKKFIDSLPDFGIDGIKRNMLSALCTQDIPQKLQGKMVEICFDFILSPTETVAVKVLSLDILSKLIKEYPDLKNELKAAIEDQIPKTTIAFQAKGKKLLRQW
ncbi:MAG: hypothetical protein K0S44_2421 [Bacteroidetes bacterium]|jgi:hypothetical protein|nr:hypothetical protein [Bacteroidota bacterium]